MASEPTADIISRLRSGEACGTDPCRVKEAASGCLCASAADEIERLRTGLRDVRLFLSKPEWGKYDYMEGSDIYTDIDAALFDISVALRDFADD